MSAFRKNACCESCLVGVLIAALLFTGCSILLPFVIPAGLASVTPPPSGCPLIGTWERHRDEGSWYVDITLKFEADGTFTSSSTNGTENWGSSGNYYVHPNGQWCDLRLTNGYNDGECPSFPSYNCTTFSVSDSTLTARLCGSEDDMCSHTYAEAAATRGQGDICTFVRP